MHGPRLAGRTRNALSALVLAFALLAPGSAGAVVGGQVDDFEDLTPMGWKHDDAGTSPVKPFVHPDGGPDGVGDAWLENGATGFVGKGSRLVMRNTAQWSGDYLTAGILRIDVDLVNLGTSPLAIRIAVGDYGAGPTAPKTGDWWASTNAFNLPADGQWYSASFGLGAADMSVAFGMASLADVLANAVELRILSAAGSPEFKGDVILGAFGADNITAVTACGDGDDNDLDGRSDFDPLGGTDDPGCASFADTTEIDETGAFPCDNGVDDDGDGLADLDDPACSSGNPFLANPEAPLENPQCDDALDVDPQDGFLDDPGADNDGTLGIDWDGFGDCNDGVDNDADGQTDGADPDCLAPPTDCPAAEIPCDPQCKNRPWKNKEKKNDSCGLGFEFALLLPALGALRRRQRN